MSISNEIYGLIYNRNDYKQFNRIFFFNLECEGKEIYGMDEKLFQLVFQILPHFKFSIINIDWKPYHVSGLWVGISDSRMTKAQPLFLKSFQTGRMKVKT